MLVIRNSSNRLTQIDNYRIQSQLIKGDFATLYHVKDLESKKEYVLKLSNDNYVLINYSESLNIEALVK